MKKKILVGLTILSLLMIAGGWNIIHINNNVIAELENIISLHEVEHLRKNLLNQVKIVQSDLLLKDSPHARDVNTFIQHVEEMDRTASICVTCHYDEKGKELLHDFYSWEGHYLKSLSRVYTIRANEERLRMEKKQAFVSGQKFIDEINNLVVRLDSKIAAKIKEAFANINSAKQLLKLFLYTSPFVIFGLVFSFLRNYTTSVAALIGATRKLKEGNLHYRLEEDLKDEFQELAGSFNEMAASIKDNYEKMQHAERLAVAGEISAGLAHEVKNPLAGIKVSIDVLRQELPLEKEDKEIFLRIINEINRIELLLKELLRYARPPQPQKILLDVVDILETTIRNAEHSLKQPTDDGRQMKIVEFVRDFAPDLPRIVADPGQLQQVFLNLMINAIDAIGKSGTVTIKTEPGAGMVQIVISDTGSGMDPNLLGKIFTPFFTTKSKGTGLGLSITKRLIEQHDGTIDVGNNPERGVSFIIRLPVPDRSAGGGER